MKKVIGFGDYIMRLNPEGYLKFIQANKFEVFYTGAEANVCTSFLIWESQPNLSQDFLKI